MTSVDLLRRLGEAGLNVTVEKDELVLSGDPPKDLEPLVGLLLCPMLALLTRRRLFAITDLGRACVPPMGVIDPRERLPDDARMLCVEGLTEWDRISSDAVLNHPECFRPSSGYPVRPVDPEMFAPATPATKRRNTHAAPPSQRSIMQ